ncbi:MAG TPA: hypothetical protein VGL09_12605, partial [Methylomirabilota bacterium]
GLGADETVALVGRRLGVTALPEPVARLIIARAEGNPFYSEELALALRDAGVITVVDGVCLLATAAGDLRALALPDTVQGVITSRIDRLTPRQQLTLKVASVIGRAFAYRVLRDVYPVEGDRPHLVAELHMLERHELMVEEKPEPDLAYLFKHVITQETAYSLLPFAQRRELHRTVAGWIERREGDDLAPFYPLLAYHWGRAEDRGKTIDYLELAGEQALRQSAYQEAVGFFTEALRRDAAGQPRNERLRRARWARQLSDAHIGLGQLTESRKHAESALALLGLSVPTSRPGLAAGLARQILRQALHRLRPTRIGRRGHQPSATELEVARADERLGRLQFYARETLPLIHSMVRGLNRAEAAGPSAELARGYANLCIGAGMLPLRSLAEAYRRRAHVTARSVGDLAALSWVLVVSGLYDVGIGRWQRARECLEESTEIAERLGDVRRVDDCRSVLGALFLHMGEFAHAARIGTDLHASARRRGDTQMMACGLAWLGRSALAVGQLDEAAKFAEEAVALAGAHDDHIAQIATNGVLALVRIRGGEPRLAQHAADTAARLIAGAAPTEAWTRDGYAGAAEVYLALWEAGSRECARSARRACTAMRKYARVFPIGKPLAGIYQGLAEWLDGRPGRAMRAWQRGLAAAERLGMPDDQARAHYEIGRHLTAQDPARRQHLERARALFERIGATLDFARATEALERSAGVHSA